MAKHVAAFCLNVISLPVVKRRSFGLTLLAEERSRWPTSDCVICHFRTSTVKRHRWGEETSTRYSLRRKGTLGSLTCEPSLVLKDVRSLNKSLVLNGLKEVVTSGQDCTQLVLQPVKGKV